MKRLLLICLTASLLSADAFSRSKADKEACDEVKEEIREIESRMRAGYTRAQGERYEAKLRKLKRKRSKVCR